MSRAIGYRIHFCASRERTRITGTLIIWRRHRPVDDSGRMERQHQGDECVPRPVALAFLRDPGLFFDDLPQTPMNELPTVIFCNELHGLLSTNDDRDRTGKSAGEKNSSDDLAAPTHSNRASDRRRPPETHLDEPSLRLMRAINLGDARKLVRSNRSNGSDKFSRPRCAARSSTPNVPDTANPRSRAT